MTTTTTTNTTMLNDDDDDKKDSMALLFDAFAHTSFCVVALDATTGRAIRTNHKFTQRLGPLYKFREYAFWDAATTTTTTTTGNSNRDRLREAIQQQMQQQQHPQHPKSNITNFDNNEEDEDDDDDDAVGDDSVCIPSVEMLTLVGKAGMPKKRHFDWTIGKTMTTNGSGGWVLLFGSPSSAAAATATTTTTAEAAKTTTATSTTETTTKTNTTESTTTTPCSMTPTSCLPPHQQKFKESEFVDFFQNAPIALHWLSENGIVLWANQTELDVLGYTAEEYIGQPIMKFCPDEQELVLEIFKQLGSGNAIKDVPVRFRTKDGRIVDLLIDSNVKYDTVVDKNDSNNIDGNKDGNAPNNNNGNKKKFGHTRCFIRDDTQRKIREARTQTLLEETKRSLQMLDNFMSRSIHHMRTPLHMMQNTCELVRELLDKELDAGDRNKNTHDNLNGGIGGGGVKESVALLRDAERQIGEAVALADDLVQLGRLDQGAELVLKKAVTDLSSWGEAVVKEMSSTATAPVSLEVQGGDGPSKIYSDPAVLHRVLRALLEHATNVNETGGVILRIGYQNNLCTFAVIYNDTKSDPSYSSEDFSPGGLPPIFQRYHQKLIPQATDAVDLETATSLRKGIERHVNSFKDNNIGISLSLAYFLVQGLGSELRYSSHQTGMDKFCFSLPKEDLPAGEECSTKLLATRVDYQNDASTAVSAGSTLMEHSSSFEDKTASSSAAPSLNLKDEAPFRIDFSNSKIACEGLSSMNPPHVLVVEDNAMCAKMLRMTLRKLNCSSAWVENGQLAVDTLRKAAPGEYNLVLMDLRMPVLDGLEATKILKQDMGLTVPIVALTAETLSSIQAECAAIGFDHFRSKPLKRDQLKEVLYKYTGYHVL